MRKWSHKGFKLIVSIIFCNVLSLGLCFASSGQVSQLIPREDLFKQISVFNPRISPDGNQLAYIGYSGKNIPCLWVRTIGQSDDRMISGDSRQGIFQYEWSHNERSLLYFQDNAGDENFHLFSQDLKNGLTRDLTPFKGIKAQNLLLARDKPDEVLIGLNIRERSLFDMYRIDLKSGALILDTENPGDVRWWLTDSHFVIRACVAINPEDSSMILRVREGQDKPWRDLIVWPFGESGVVEGYGSELAVAFTPDGKDLYVQSALHSDTTQLIKVDSATGKELEVVASHPKANIWNTVDITLYSLPQILISPENGRIQAIAFDYQKPEWTVLESGLTDDFEFLGQARQGVITIPSRDNHDARWIIGYIKDDKPMTYYLYDRANKELQPIFPLPPETAGQRFSPTKPIVIDARDGLEIPCYLTLPEVNPAKNLPMVLLVHGGPWTRDEWGFDPTVQWLANRGYAVLQVNYRGSEGFGKRFMNAGNGQWGVGLMQHDLTDAVKGMIREGIADPKRVAIMGGSYGGYAALAGLAFTPEIYACGVDMFGPSNVRTTFKTFPDFWKPLQVRWIRRVGDVEKDGELNQRISPLFHVQNIRAPLLIEHGANDPRVKIQESEQIVRIMRENKLPVIFVVYPDEGHGILRKENVLDFYGRVEEFLAEHLGGRFEPWNKIEGSSAEIH